MGPGVVINRFLSIGNNMGVSLELGMWHKLTRLKAQCGCPMNSKPTLKILAFILKAIGGH